MNTDPGSPREPSGEASLERVAGLLQPEISSISSRLESDPSFIPPTLEEIAKKIGLSVELATKVLEASDDEGIKQYLKAEQEVLKRADELGPIQTRSYVWLTLARLDEEVRIPSLPTLAAQYDTSELVVKLVLRKLKPEDRELFLERAQKTEQLDLQDNVAAAVLGVVIANVATPGIQVDPVKFDQATARQFRCEPDQVKRIREKLRVGRELFVEGATEQPVLELAQTQPTSTTVTTTLTPEVEGESPETAPERDPSTFVAELTAIATGEAPFPEGVTTANGLGDALGMRRGQFVYARRQLDHDTDRALALKIEEARNRHNAAEEKALENRIASELKQFVMDGEIPTQFTRLNALARHFKIPRGKLDLYLESALDPRERTEIIRMLKRNSVDAQVQENRGDVIDALKAIANGERSLPEEACGSYEALARHLGYTHYQVDKAARRDLSEDERRSLKAIIGTGNKQGRIGDSEEAQLTAAEREEALKQEIVPRLKALASGEEDLPESVTNLNKLAKHLAISRGKLTGYLDELLERDEKTAVMEVVRTNHLTVLTAESRGEITATLKALVDGTMALPEGVDSYRTLAKHFGVHRYKVDRSATEDLTNEEREKLKTLLGTANKTRSLEDARVALAPAVERIRRFIAGEEEIPNRLHTQPRLAKALGISAYDLSVVLDKIIESEERKQLMDKLNDNRWARLAKRKAAEYQDIIEPLEAIGRGERSFPAEIATVAELGQHLEADEKRFQTAWNNHFDKDLRTKVAELLDTNRRARDEADLQEKYQPVLEKLTRYATGEEEIPQAITTVEELAATFELHEVVLKRIYGAHLDDGLQRTFIEKLEVNRRAREIAQHREQYSSVYEGIENIVEGRVPPPVADSYGKLASYLGTSESRLRTILDKFDEEVENRLCKLVGLQDIERLKTDRQGVVREVAAHIRAEFDAYRQDESARLEPSHELGKRFGLTLGEISIALREGLTRDERKEREARIKEQGKEQRKDERQAKNVLNCREYVNAQVLQFLRGKEDSLLGNSALAVRYGLTDEDVDGIISSLQPWRREMRQKVLAAFTDLQRKREIREEYKEHLKR